MFKRFIQHRLDVTETEISRLANIISDNQGLYGPGYNSTIEYAYLMRDYRLMQFLKELYKRIL